MKYALDGKLIGYHSATLAASESKHPKLADSYCDIIEKRLTNKPGDENVRQQESEMMQDMLHSALTSWQRVVIKEEDDALTVEDLQSTMAVDNILYQTVAMQARLPYHLREDPDYSDDDPPLELAYRVVSLIALFEPCDVTQWISLLVHAISCVSPCWVLTTLLPRSLLILALIN